MKHLFLVAGVILSLATKMIAAESAANEFTAIDRSLGNFYGLVVNTHANVIITQGEKTSIRMEGRKKDLEKIDASISNGSLVLNGTNTAAVTIYVTVSEINRVEVNSTARVFSSEIISSDVLLLKVNGNGSIRLDVRALSLGMLVKGKGKIVVSGTAGDSYARVLGDGRINSANLDAYSSRLEVNNGSEATVKEQDKSGRRLTLRMTN